MSPQRWMARVGVALLAMAAAVAASAADRPGQGVYSQGVYSQGASGGKLKWIGAASDPAPAAADRSPSGPALVRPVQHTDAVTKPERASGAKPEKIGRPSLTDRVLDSKADGGKVGLQPFVQESATAAAPKGLTGAADNGPRDNATLQTEKIESCVKLDSLAPINPNILDKIAPEGSKFPPNCPMARLEDKRRDWAPTEFHWTASALCAKPAYFSDVHLERYGHTSSPLFQPLVSAGHFFLSVPALPYAIGLYPPNECVYTLGYYRPGSCAPHYLDPFPISVRAAVLEAGAVVGLAAFIP